MASESPNNAAPTRRWTPTYTLILSAVVAAAYLFVTYLVLRNLNDSNQVESTRLLLVLTLIIAMLGFGGLLIARALFSRETGQELQDRFRLAREIFLVFAGIFGTIIGFYFGTQDDDAATQQLQVEAKWAAGQVTATMTGGAAPFIGILTPKDGNSGQVARTDTRVLTYKAATCPNDTTITIADGAGHSAEATVSCGEGNNQTGQAATNVANAVNQAAASNGASNTQ